MESLTPEIVKQMIDRTSRLLTTTDNEKRAYKQGAQMMYEFCLMNPNIVKSQEAEEFISLLLFPSTINLAI